MITDEKRAFKRVNKKFTVKFRVPDPGRAGGSSVSENISMGGVYFISFEKFDIGQLLECSIEMPGVTEEGKWRSRVVRCEELGSGMVKTFGIAVEFVEPAGASQKNLEKALKS